MEIIALWVGLKAHTAFPRVLNVLFLLPLVQWFLQCTDCGALTNIIIYCVGGSMDLWSTHAVYIKSAKSIHAFSFSTSCPIVPTSNWYIYKIAISDGGFEYDGLESLGSSCAHMLLSGQILDHWHVMWSRLMPSCSEPYSCAVSLWSLHTFNLITM